MASFTDYTENKVLDHVVGKTSWTMPAIWVARCTAAPSDTGGGTEVTGGAYARKATAAADWAASAAGATSNATVLTFVTPSASWGTVTHFALMDALTVGNMIAWAPLTTSQAIGSGNTVSFAVGDLDVTLS